MWVFFVDPWGIFFAGQVISSFAWTAFNLAASNFIFDNIPSTKRGEYQAHYSLIVGIGITIGSLLGSLLVAVLPFSQAWTFKSVFLISGVLRAIIFAIFIPKIKEARTITRFSFSFRPIFIYRWLQEVRLREARKKPRNGMHKTQNKKTRTKPKGTSSEEEKAG